MSSTRSQAEAATPSPFGVNINLGKGEAYESFLLKLIQLIGTPIQYPSLAKLNEMRLQYAQFICSVLIDSRKRDFPDYMEFVLNTPDFKIFIFPVGFQGEIKAVGKYVGRSNSLGLWMPQTDGGLHYLISEIIPHEFWHAYQTALRAKDHNPKAALENKSGPECLQGQAPYDTEEEGDELKRALKAGQDRITKTYLNLLKKKSEELSAAEKSSLEEYNAAVSDYSPSSYDLTQKIAAKKQKKVIKDIYEGREELWIGDPQISFYPYTHTIDKDAVTFSGFLVKNPDKEKAEALIRDTNYLMLTLIRDYSLQISQSSEKLTYLTEYDAYLAPHSKKLNDTFYPERAAFHKKMRCKHLRDPDKVFIFDSRNNLRAEDRSTGISAKLSDRLSRSILFFPRTLEWDEVLRAKAASLDYLVEHRKYK